MCVLCNKDFVSPRENRLNLITFFIHVTSGGARHVQHGKRWQLLFAMFTSSATTCCNMPTYLALKWSMRCSKKKKRWSKHLQEFAILTWHPYNFSKTRKNSLQQFGKTNSKLAKTSPQRANIRARCSRASGDSVTACLCLSRACTFCRVVCYS